MPFAPLHRRIGVVIAVAASVAVSGCSATSPPGGGADGEQFTFVSFGGAYGKAQKAAFLDPYQKENPSVRIIEESATTEYAKITAMVDANNVSWDVVDADPFFPLGENCGKYTEKLDFTVIDTTKMPKAFVSDCAVPSMTYSYVLMYRKDKYGDNPPQSWADFFDTGKFPGTRAIENNYIGGGFEIALLADGVAPDALYPIDYDRAFRKLDTMKQDLKFWKTGSESQQMMEAKQADMVVAWTGRAYNAVKNGAPYGPVWNQALATYDVFMVPKGSKNKAQAMKFIAYATSAGPQARLTENIPYAPINSDAKPDITDSVAKQFLSTEQGDAGQGVPLDQKWYAENQKTASDKWTKWTTG